MVIVFPVPAAEMALVPDTAHHYWSNALVTPMPCPKVAGCGPSLMAAWLRLVLVMQLRPSARV